MSTPFSMKNKRIPFISGFALVCLLFLVASCQFNSSSNPSNQDNRLESKHVPNEYFSLQRAYPDESFSLKAFEKGIKQAKETSLLKNDPGFDLEWTTQGPGNLGARINTVAVHPENEDIIYVGYSMGGVWKTIDGGLNWSSIFDEQIYLSIGDIAIDPNNPEIIFVGTGDPNISGYPFIGDGIYKSEDAGQTWNHLGLTETRIISKIIIDPSNSNNLFVSSMGLPFERNEDRGLYKSVDGGETWNQVLFLSDESGISDMVMDPFNTQVLYASGWDRIRNNSESIVSGPNGKIHKTVDGGETWEILENGLPEEEEMCRTGLAISKMTPGLIYAMFVRSDDFQVYGIYKSEDAGANWAEIPTEFDQTGLNPNALGGFGWYFGKLRVNPINDNDLFLLGVSLWRTLDAGGSWFPTDPNSVHADKHDLFFSNNGTYYLGTDGGLYQSPNGFDWEDIENIPTTQFYRVGYNPHKPELYYGGAQDNGTSSGNFLNINDWEKLAGADGFQPAFNPELSEVFYVETQNGGIRVTENGGNNFSSGTGGLNQDDRKNWDMPYFISIHNSNVLYTGTFRVYKSSVGAVPNFEQISEDLTDGIIFNPRYHTITTLQESPIIPGLLYVGTVDANVWRTDDDGDSWINITDGLPERYVTDIKASPTDEDWVYVTHSGYKDNDFIPRVHFSDNRGEDWYDITGDLPDLAVNDIYIIPGYEDLVIFVATDGGVYGTQNAGENWQRVGTNMPFITTYDLEWNEANNELVAGTFGRSIMSYTIDSLLNSIPDNPSSIVSPSSPIIADLKLFPSPATNYVHVEFNNNEADKVAEIVVLDVNGKLLIEEKNTDFGKVQHQINISELPTGQYFVKIKVRHSIRSGSFIKH